LGIAGGGGRKWLRDLMERILVDAEQHAGLLGASGDGLQ
jgi:hypothetical protein